VASYLRFGLHVVYEPESTNSVDIIFIHGLGGDRILTWCKDKDRELFWPEKWLPKETTIANCRILSFGYDASFFGSNVKNIYRISDFAKSLLHELRFGQDDKGRLLGIGKVPIVFVVHSMGGLVAKATYLLGQNDEHYAEIVQSIRGMIFLATPHRGADQATNLNNILRASFQSPKDFIAELQKGSSAIEDINEQFRHVANKLTIASFYETHATKIGKFNFMVVTKDSATLGYQQEISAELKADHHGVCKYSSRQDPNYLSVRNTLASIVEDFRRTDTDIARNRKAEQSAKIEKLLSITSSYQEDFRSLHALWLNGTCAWILEEKAMKEWIDEECYATAIHLVSPPASGKSVLCSYLIDHLLSDGYLVQYFFFRSEDRNKRAVNFFLRSMAAQLAESQPDYKEKLLDMADSGFSLAKSSSADVFRKLFELGCANIRLRSPVYWVIDAFDESESPQTVLQYIFELQEILPSLRIFLTSRSPDDVPITNKRTAILPRLSKIDASAIKNSADIELYLEQMVNEMDGNSVLKEHVTKAILRRAQGNFLWVRLVLSEILNCHTEEAIQDTLQKMPDNMNQLYERMENAILASSRVEDKDLAQKFLLWIVCSHHTLTLHELDQALGLKFVNLRKTVVRVCGQFVTVDPSGHVRLTHQTAYEYLTKTAESEIAVDLVQGHSLIFGATILTINSNEIRLRVQKSLRNLQESEPFLAYAATSWMYHLQQVGVMDETALDLLIRFFKGPSILVWIHILTILGRLEMLAQAAQVLLSCAKKLRKFNASKNPMLHRLSDLDYLEQWSVDLVKLVGKFSRQLLSNPSAIYDLVAPFCPSSSILHQQFYKADRAEIKVSGITQQDWSDNLVRVSLPQMEQGIKICCSAQYVTVLVSSGTIYLWHSSHFGQILALQHQEAATAMSFSQGGNKLITFGLLTSKLWSIPSGELLATIINPAGSRALTIAFGDEDCKVLVACTNKLIYYLNLEDLNAGWTLLSEDLLRETSEIDGTVVNSPKCVAFNINANQVGVSYRGFPLSVWDLGEMRCIARCKRSVGTQKEARRGPSGWFAVDKFTWNSVTGHIIGLYKDGTVFKWHPVTNDYQEVPSMADEIASSPNGKLFVTSSSNGTVRVWNFDYFSVIYQLSSGDLVSELAFSPDSERFYDIRGSSLNAWQSNSLLRYVESEESFSDATSEDHRSTSLSNVSEAYSRQYEAVSVISAATQGCTLYCAGNEEGMVTLFDTQIGRIGDIGRLPNFTSIACISWSKDSKHIAYVDLAGDIEVGNLVVDNIANGASSSAKVCQKGKPRIDTSSGIYELVFNHDASLLFIASTFDGYIWSVNEGSLKMTRSMAQLDFHKWANHPTDPDVILGFGTGQVVAYRWSDFSEIKTWVYIIDGNLRLSSSLSAKNALPLVRSSKVAQDGQHIILRWEKTETEDCLMVLNLACLEISNEHHTDALSSAIGIPSEVTAKVDVLLGLLPGSKLVFFDEHLWVCTYALGSSSTKRHEVERHYFIPRDWASSEIFEQCLLLDNGTLLCPREDEVAVITSELASGF
jgi:WD40 repeat protein/pimeloyl-ACP methyl ester carboxylesterase